MEQQVIQVEKRQADGKGAARKLRFTGRIPAVLYGHKQTPVSLTLDPHDFRKKVKISGLGRNTVFKLTGLDRDIMALVKDAQVDPVSRALLHLDLVEIRDTDRVIVDVPLEFTGKPAGVTAGGMLQIVQRTIAVETSPLSIPRLISVDVSHLEIATALHVSDVAFPAGTKSGSPAGTNFALATVLALKAEEERPAAAADAATPAAAAATPAAPAADAKKKADKK